MKIYTLLNAVSSTGAGNPVKIDIARMKFGSIPIQIHGTFSGTVELQGTIATDQEVTENTCTWTAITNAEWTAPTCDALFAAFTHIRANVSVYSSGTITLKVLI